MKLENCRNTYYEYTGKASEIVRYLGFAGIALVWIFKVEGGGTISIPQPLIAPSFWLVIGLTLDLFHYVVGSIIWGVYNRYKEKIGTKECDEFIASLKINWPTNFFFWSKIIAIIIAYILIIRFLYV